MITVHLPRPVVCIELPIPPRQLLPNTPTGSSRLSRTRLMKACRTQAGWAFKQANQAGLKLQVATVRPVFFWPDRRRRDSDNMASAMKPYWDGMQDSGLIANDAGLTHLPPVNLLDREKPRVELEVFDVKISFVIGGLGRRG